MPSVARVLYGQLRGARHDPTARRALRMSVRLLIRRSSAVFQPYNDTLDDRYPEVFARLSALDNPSLTVVSFGCSVGDELVTLRRYFPTARLVGIDASAANVAECRSRLAAASMTRVDVRQATNLRHVADGSVDIVFAMAVFRHGALTSSGAATCRPFLRFAAFDASIADIVRCLRPGGAFFLEHSNFRVGDTACADRLVPFMTRPHSAHDAGSPYYGPDDRLQPSPDQRELGFSKA